MDGDPTPAWTGRRRTRPTSIGCPNPWQPEPGRAPLIAAHAAVQTNRATSVLKPSEVARSHVEGSIRRAESDLNTMTDRRGRPYSLVCTKNQASYDRRAKQRKQDLKDLALLTG